MGFSEEEYEQLKSNMSGKVAPQKKMTKYRNKPTKFRGYTYPSKLEAEKARVYHAIVMSGKWRCILRQVKIDLTPHQDEETNYIIDFIAIDKSGEAIFIEVKGRSLPRFKMIKKLWLDWGPGELMVVFKDRTETVPMGQYVK